MKIFKIFFLLVIFFLTSTGVFSGQDIKLNNKIIGLSLSDYRIYLKTHPPLDRLYIADNICYFLVKDKEIAGLKKSRFKILSIHNIPSLPQNKSLYGTGSQSNGSYHSYSETGEFLENLSSQYPDKAKLVNLGKSVEGRDIMGLKISDNVSMNENKPRIYIMGCHHAREWISVEMPLLFARHILQNQTDQRIKILIKQTQIYIIPLVNPDGLEYSIYTYRMWRKNRKYNGDFIWGVDLNRNYGYKWGYDNEGSSPDPAYETYRGDGPFSEPESRAIRDFMEANKPAGSLSFHNHSNLILYPWGYTGVPCPDNEEFETIARGMSERIYQVNQRFYQYGSGALAIYPTNGDTDDWVYGTFRVPAFTIELPHPSFEEGGFITSEEEINRTFSEMLPAMLFFIENIIARTSTNTPTNRPSLEKGAKKEKLIR